MNYIRERWNNFSSGQKRYMIILCVLSLVLRLGYAFTVDLVPMDMTGVDLDAVEYDYLGWSVANGHGYTDREGNPNSIRFPGYVFFLTVIYFLFGRHHEIVLVIQAFIGVISPLLIYAAARHLFSEKVSRIAGILAAIHPVWIWYVGWLMTENIFMPLLNALIYLTVRMRRNANWKQLALMGILIGGLGLTRGIGLPFWGIIPAYVFFKSGNGFGNRFKQAFIVWAFALLTLTPWTIRNYLNYDQIMLPSSEGPGILWMAVNMEHTNISDWYKLDDGFAYVDSVGRENATSEEFYWILNQHNHFGYIGARLLFARVYPDESIPESDADAMTRLGEKAKISLRESPESWLFRSILQIPRFWHVLDERGRYVNGYAYIIPFFFIGFFLMIRRFVALIPLYIFPAVLYMLSLALWADARFRMPFEGVFMIVGAVAMERFIRWFKRPSIAYSLLTAWFLFNYYLRLHSHDVRMTIRAVLAAVGFPIGDM
ncbi:glycosyltransferase family 39 protein [bacterium]|nr:glycosyltransferase family 39 protein [bacterium]